MKRSDERAAPTRIHQQDNADKRRMRASIGSRVRVPAQVCNELSRSEERPKVMYFTVFMYYSFNPWKYKREHWS
jgi:hypothetical protein